MAKPFPWLEQPKFSALEVRGIALAGVYLAGENSGASIRPVDDLDTHLKFMQKRSIKSGWGIRDHDTAMEIMSALLEGMHAPDFDVVLSHVLPVVDSSLDDKRAHIYSMAEQFGPEIGQLASNFLAALALPSTPKPIPASTYAWDLSRLAQLARVTVGVGYVAPQEVLPLLAEGAHRSQQVFSDWNDYGRSFILGRALWVATDQPTEEVDKSNREWTAYFDTLLTEPTSPWLRLPW